MERQENTKRLSTKMKLIILKKWKNIVKLIYFENDKYLIEENRNY